MAVSWPTGVWSAGVPAGIKKSGKPDLGLIVLDAAQPWAATFTKSGAAAAPVLWSRALLTRGLRAIVVNSGNANACTGEAGTAAVVATARAAAATLGCSPEEIAVASTGPIGVRLPVDAVVQGIPHAARSLSSDATSFADAILTTDSVRKTAVSSGAGFNVVGVAKGSGMLAPNMATMLAFIATDAAADAPTLQHALSEAVRISFDRVCVDGCQSTNDSVFLVSTGAAGPIPEGDLRSSVAAVCTDLAEQMVRDAEGASRLVRVRVRGADDERSADALARGVANSALWRAAAHGGDPNWGRILAALGAVDPDLDLHRASVSIGPETVFHAGEPTGSLEAAAKALAGRDVSVTCRVGEGPGEAEILTCDLSPKYVDLNAGGMS